MVIAPRTTVELRVADVERSVRFYRGLGLELTDSDEAEGWLLRAEMGGVLVLAQASEDPHEHGPAVRIRLQVPDLASFAARATEAGLRPGSVVDGGLELVDPDGWPVTVHSA